MAVTTMPSITKIASSLKQQFADIKFVPGDNFYWTSATNTVTHKPIKSLPDIWLLMHEIAHAQLGHADYESDVELIRYEALAWQHAKAVLAPLHALQADEDFIEDALDTYRVWLHKRSLCPNCAQTGIQQKENTYNCLNCRCSWRVNEARLCNFRRKALGGSFASAAN